MLNDAVPEAVVQQGMTEMRNYLVTLVYDRSVAGSGILVTAADVVGILTAQHVIAKFTKRPEAPMGIILAGYVHSFDLERDERHITIIGSPEDSKGKPELGPDLAFIRILDVAKIGTIRSIKSFYPLDLKNFGPYANDPKEYMRWFITGAPDELTGELQGDILPAVMFAGAVQFVSYYERGEFDFMRMTIDAGVANFPRKYGGVSGGGLWLLPLSRDETLGEGGVSYLAPILVGIAFYEVEVEAPNTMHLICHGPQSIYSKCLRHIATAV